jgi:hypothetical protein
VVEQATDKDLLFFPRNVGDLKRQAASEVTMRDAFEPLSLNDQTATIYRCDWDDLAVVATSPDALGAFVEFFDTARFSADPADNDVVIRYGLSDVEQFDFPEGADYLPRRKVQKRWRQLSTHNHPRSDRRSGYY